MNVLVYVSDALRADHLGCYGARFLNTRTIDDLAAGGVRFDQAISAAPWTAPSTTSLVTGLYAHHHGYLHWDATLDPTIETVFRAFAAHDYEVASFVFDRNYLFKDLPEANVLGTSESLDGAVAWLRANRRRPFLLYFHSWATHMPYDVLHAERGDWLAAKQEVIDGIQSDSASALEALREAYRQAVERQSETIFASLLEELDSLGLRERTVLAFTSDHGESWGERFAAKQDVKGVYHLHGATVYDEIVQLPLILSAPGRLAPATVRSQVRSVDLVPTLLELAGLPVGEIDGRSLLPLLDGREQGDRPAVIAGTDLGALTKLAVRMPPWKLILHVETGEEEAYRLDLDPRERESRPSEAPPELRELVFRELESAERHELTEEEEATVTKRLSDLGYL
ncbi:MAG TPA: sulfatase [Gaiellaceae bacterium]|nr:sulfatase [Gaiellaceae bacterium]